MFKFISLSSLPRRIQWVAGIMAMVGGWERMYVDVCLYACGISTCDPKLLRRGKGIPKEWVCIGGERCLNEGAVAGRS